MYIARYHMLRRFPGKFPEDVVDSFQTSAIMYFLFITNDARINIISSLFENYIIYKILYNI